MLVSCCKIKFESRKSIHIGKSANMLRGVARIFQRAGAGGGGKGSHCVKVRVLARLSCRFCHLL